MKKDKSERIIIKEKGKYFKVAVEISFFIIVAMISGVIGGQIAARSILNENYIDDLKNNSKSSADEAFSKGITNISHSIVTISDSPNKLKVNSKESGNVTGIIIDKQGYIVTSLSRIKEMDEGMWVKLPSLAKEPVEAALVGGDINTDIGLIKIDTDEAIPAVISNADTNLGDVAVAVGNSISNDFVGMATIGVVTSINRNIYDEKRDSSYRIIQTSAVMNDDNIGGALCNTKGEVVGFNSYILNNDKGNSSLYYALSADAIRKVVNYIIDFTDKLGISVQLIDDKQSGVRGLYIKNIKSDGYAAKAGILPTDIILEVDGCNIASLEDINKIIKAKKKGENIECEILRDGVKTSVVIVFD